jgi:hypothetical protein
VSPRKAWPLGTYKRAGRKGAAAANRNELYSLFIIITAMMLSTLKLTTLTGIGREEEKKLSLILTYLIELPEASEFIHPVDWEGTLTHM